MSRSRVWTGLALAVVVMVVVVVGALRFVSSSAQPLAVGAVESITGPSEITAGDDVTLVVTAASDVPVTLLISTPSSERHEVLQPSGGIAELVLDASTTRLGNLVTVTAAGAVEPRHDIDVAPSPTVGNVDLFIAGRSFRQGDEATATVIVADEFGNPAADGTAVELIINDDAGGSIRLAGSTVGGRASILFVPQVSNVLTVSAQSDGVHSRPERLTRLAGAPLPFSITPVVQGQNVADAVTRVPFTSDAIVDGLGTALADGTVVTLMIDGPDGAGMASGQMRSGRIEASVVAPGRPGELTITPIIADTVGEPLSVNFAPAVQPFDIHIDRQPDGIDVAIGPVFGWHGGIAPDGTPVDVNGQTTWLTDGTAQVRLDLVTPDPQSLTPVVVEVRGVQGGRQ